MAGRAKKVFFYGCVGCLSTVVLVVGVLGIGLLWAQRTGSRLGAPAADEASRSIPLSAALSGFPDRDAGAPAVGGPALDLDIDLVEGLFEVLPAPAGSDLRIEGKYAANYYELVEEREAAGEMGERVRIRLEPTAGLLTRILQGLTIISDQHPNQLVVHVPRGVPTRLTLAISSGKSDSNLGGLHLEALDVQLRRGDHRLRFDEPVPGAMEKVTILTEMGEGTVRGLGNVRAARFDILSRMGHFEYGLQGEWLPASHTTFSFSHSMGDLEVSVPREVRIDPDSRNTVVFGELNNGSLRPREDQTDAEDAPVVRIDLSTRMGGARLSRR